MLLDDTAKLPRQDDYHRIPTHRELPESYMSCAYQDVRFVGLSSEILAGTLRGRFRDLIKKGGRSPRLYPLCSASGCAPCKLGKRLGTSVAVVGELTDESTVAIEFLWPICWAIQSGDSPIDNSIDA